MPQDVSCHLSLAPSHRLQPPPRRRSGAGAARVLHQLLLHHSHLASLTCAYAATLHLPSPTPYPTFCPCAPILPPVPCSSSLS